MFLVFGIFSFALSSTASFRTSSYLLGTSQFLDFTVNEWNLKLISFKPNVKAYEEFGMIFIAFQK